ncbi:uncharacterized protein LOC104415890 isoform X2 [Eucalyptus grandis]|uniref:uncharacterized protein LOC104415890 isoform X2 n=1 Tax=Eucalyptus grandis TaxID=71139 RepID=UPI00192EED51|nr:uncharacterized protein LOC104415890 isoform X2 [Eucalyptus grandis]
MMEEGGGAAMARMEGRASIDGEPKTLSFHQIKLAREAALDVVNTCTVEEALRIFTEGLEPIICCGNGLDREEEPNEDENDELRLPQSLRDVISAPF